jgi:hypothetical protein
MKVSGEGVTKTIALRTQWIVGGACFWGDFGGGFGIDYVNNGQAFISLAGDGTFFANRGTIGAGTPIGQSDPAFAVHLNRYYYLEMGLLIAPGAGGQVIIHLNGQEIMNLTGVNTDPNAVGIGDVVHLFGPGGGAGMFVDDFYVCDVFGAHNNNFLGDTQIGLIMPASDGFHQDWTPHPAGTHFSNVNEIPPDGDATYNASSTNGQIDSYNFDPVDATRTYFGIQTNLTARKDDSGDRALSPMARIGGVDFVKNPLGTFVNQTYIDYTDAYDVNPATGNPWTGAEINAAQYGVKVVF